MSLKRSSGSMRTGSGAAPTGAKVGRQELYDELKKLAASNQPSPRWTSPWPSARASPRCPALLGLAAEGCLDKLEGGQYRVSRRVRRAVPWPSS